MPPGEANDGVKEFDRRLVADQPLAVFAEGARIERGLLEAHVEKPAKQDVVGELLAKEAVGPHRIKRNEKRGLQKPLRRDRGPAGVAIHRREGMTQRGQSLIGVKLDGAQGMIRRHARLRREIAEQMAMGIDFTAHPGTAAIKYISICVHIVPSRSELMKGFSATC